ncbi:MAG: hypothetical protein QNK33_03410 [Bacteroidales bacterium]|nr:hypothetical protein [Bacteroidales bacterium]
MLKRIILYILLFLLVPFKLAGQYYNTGQDPASLKWELLSTDHFNFIYPTSYNNQALKTARIFEESYHLLKGRYNEKELKKFPIIIHNHTTESNGYVTWAPKRMELYPFPGQTSIPLGHTEQLALHELVHVTQMQGLREGMSKPLEFLLGEQYPGALSILTPFWFLEGDAVLSETKNSLSGRGRQPSFEKGLKALLLDNDKIVSYDKMINSSFKNYTPDHYRFGYQMLAYANSKIDTSLFSSALNLSARRPWLLNPFNVSLRRDAGLTKKGLYEATMSYIQSEWKAEDSKLNKSKFTYLSPESQKEYTNYYCPLMIGLDSVIAIKTSYSKPPAFVLLASGERKEKHILTPGILWPYHFSYSNGIIVWSEHISDARWNNREYSVIKSYNINKRETKQLTRKGRLFSPAISNKGLYIVAVESTAEYVNSIVIIDRQSGQELERYRTPDNELPVYPQWDNKDNRIVFISFSDDGEGIMELNRRSKGYRTLIPEGRNDLQSLCIRNDSLFYVSSYSGIDNVFIRLPDGEIKQASSSRFGTSFVSLKNDKILFSDYSSMGERAAMLRLSTIKTFKPEPKHKELLFASEFDSKSSIHNSKETPLEFIYKIEEYKKWKHLFNIHSWMPFYSDVNNVSFDNLAVSPGLTLMSQNHLSTLSSSLGYEYAKGEHIIHSSILWRAWYPAIDLDISYGGKPFVYQDEDDLYYPNKVYPGLKASVSVFLPLRFRTGKFSQTIWPSVKLAYKNNYVFEEDGSQFDYGQLQLSTRAFISNLHRMSKRDIWPRWGQVLDASYISAPGDEQIYGNVAYLRLALYMVAT